MDADGSGDPCCHVGAREPRRDAMTELKVTAAVLGSAAVVSFVCFFHRTAEAKPPLSAPEEIREVESTIDRIEAETMAQIKYARGQFQRLELLGKLLLFE